MLPWAIFLSSIASAVQGQEVQPCANCHRDLKAASEAHKGIDCDNCHSNIESDKHGSAMTDLPAAEMCSNCHPSVPSQIKGGLHQGLECNVCHGTMHDDFARTDNRACARCHGETARALREGVHGQLWARGQEPMLCASCHSGHDTTPAKLHPLVVLRDEQGRPVAGAGTAASPARSCDGCHDVAWISRHSYHPAPAASQARASAPSCFLCHVQDASNADRLAEMATGRESWSETAVLSGTGLVRRQAEGWQWMSGVFAADGSAPPRSLRIQAPGARECGFCHGLVYQSKKPLSVEVISTARAATANRYGEGDQTERTGIIFSDQLIRESALNIPDKVNLDRPWDVHLGRSLTCKNCHVAPNHPAYALAPSSSARHLMFEPRRLSIGEYLKRPDHRLAPGAPAAEPPDPKQARVAEMRRCEGCHGAPTRHSFLPRPARHLAALECQACHIPRLYSPARQEVDWTVPVAPGRPRITYRGVAYAAQGQWQLLGYEPVLLPSKLATGATKLSPFNVITTWSWVSRGERGPRPVDAELLARAVFDGERYQADLVRALDRNGDGQLDPDELILDTADRVAAVAARLKAAGAEDPRIEGKLELVPINHGVGPSRGATRSCESCHHPKSRITEPFLLSSSAPFGGKLDESAIAGKLAGEVHRDAAGRLTFEPIAGRQGVYLFGRSSNKAIDALGIAVLSGAIALAVVHGGLRYRRGHRRKETGRAPGGPR